LLRSIVVSKASLPLCAGSPLNGSQSYAVAAEGDSDRISGNAHAQRASFRVRYTPMTYDRGQVAIPADIIALDYVRDTPCALF